MITINNLTVRLGGRPILEKASAAIPGRARVGLVGRNGSGKSTLLKVLIGEIEPDEGSVGMPRRNRIGHLAQEAPAGETSPFELVLAADVERTDLLERAESCENPGELGEIHERLIAIDAHSAPARAARILNGLGIDEVMQAQPLDSLSGGWRMRAALAALLFSEPDLLLLDEPSNHLDLEATLWLESFLKSYPGTLMVISHERDLLNNVVDAILHLQGGRLTFYPGGYDSFERQRAERAAQQETAKAAQETQRAKLEGYIARNRARASTARQAQSRAKMLAKLQPIAALLEDPSLSFEFPDPSELRPPLITLDEVAVGYGGEPVLKRLNLRIDPDERIALLGRNGSGKTTLARLLSGQLACESGSSHGSRRMTVGYFTQYQVEELSSASTPLELMTQAMAGKSPAAVRGQLGRFGFSGKRATASVATLSGGERARLALALVTRDAPHLLILDEPTNHLDVDTREALVQALNDYQGAVVLVSHDRHMIELTADRLILVHKGTAAEYPGSFEDYVDFVLGRDQPERDSPARSRKKDRQAAARTREETRAVRNEAAGLERSIAELQNRISGIDRAIFDPGSADPKLGVLTMGELSRQRATLVSELERAEENWIAASERLQILLPS